LAGTLQKLNLQDPLEDLDYKPEPGDRRLIGINVNALRKLDC